MRPIYFYRTSTEMGILPDSRWHTLHCLKVMGSTSIWVLRTTTRQTSCRYRSSRLRGGRPHN